MTEQSVITQPENQEIRIPWEFILNDEKDCLEFNKLDEIYPINGEQALSIGFLKIEGSPQEDEHKAENASNKIKNKFRGPIVDDMFELTYRYEHPVLVRGYIIESANDDPDSDPKDWKINCRNIETNFEHDIHQIEGEETRDRDTEKEYRINEDARPVWTDRISIRVSVTQGGGSSCQLNQWIILTDFDVIKQPEDQKPRDPWTFIPNMDVKCLEFQKKEDEPLLAAIPLDENVPAIPEPEDKDPEINVPDKSDPSTNSSSDSDSDSSESDVEIDDDEHPEHRSLCCKCCRIKFSSTIKMINWPFLICMTLATVLAGMSIGSALFNDGPIANIIQARQKWPKQYAKQMNKYFLIAPTVGITLGATIAGAMMKKGRRSAFLIFPLVGCLGSILSVFDNYFLMMIGKFLFGLGAGVCITVAPRVLEETIPPEYFDKYGFGAMTNVGVDIMVLTNTIMVLFMPKEGQKHVTEAILAKSDLYKWLYLIPVPLFGTAFILAIMCFRRETPGFYIHKKDKVHAVRALRQIFMGEKKSEYLKKYKKMVDSDEEHPEEVNDFLKSAEASMAKTNAVTNKAQSAVKKGESDVKKGESDVKKGEKDADTADADLEGGATELVYIPPNQYIQFEGGESDAKKDEKEADKEKDLAKEVEQKTEKEIKAEKAKLEAECKAKAKAELFKYVPKWAIGSPGNPGGIECLVDHEYREGTWMCIALAFFNVLSGVTTLLIYLALIFKQADNGKQIVTLTATQMGSALAFALSAGAGASTKLIAKLTRRQMFCLSHLMIGILLTGAAFFTRIENGMLAFICIWGSQFWVQCLTAPLFIYQTEVLQNNALGMVTSFRAICFTGLKLLVVNLVTSRDPILYVRLYEILYFFGFIQLLAVVVIWEILPETKGLSKKEKASLSNPYKRDKKANKALGVKAAPIVPWEETPFQKKENPMTTKINNFVNNTFVKFGLDPEVHSLNKHQVQLLLVDLMHKHHFFEAWDNHDFDQLYDLFEEDEVDTDDELLDEVKKEAKRLEEIMAHKDGLDKGELTKLFKRLAQI